MIAISDEQMLELVRSEIAAAVERERPLIREEIIDSLKWVTQETGVTMLEITGKDPLRTFRRLMNTYGVETFKLGGLIRYRWKKRPIEKKGAGLSIEELIERHVVKASSKRKPKLQPLHSYGSTGEDAA